MGSGLSRVISGYNNVSLLKEDEFKLQYDLESDRELSQENVIGLNNYQNSCYCNSVIQALYTLEDFRNQCMKEKYDKDKTGICQELANLFGQMLGSAKFQVPITPKNFLFCLRKSNLMFKSEQHQDAHEFYMYIINLLSDNAPKCYMVNNTPKTWIQVLFEGTLVYEMSCLKCSKVTFSEEPFVDLSLDIEENSSIFSCIKKMSKIEYFKDDEQYFCDNCNSKQDAQRIARVSRLPKILVVHLKRFHYNEQLGIYQRKQFRVVFPPELRLFESKVSNNDITSSNLIDEKGFVYELNGIVVHIGASIKYGHYISCVKRRNCWFQIDDQTIHNVSTNVLSNYYGESDSGYLKKDNNLAVKSSTKCGYLLFYKMID